MVMKLSMIYSVILLGIRVTIVLSVTASILTMTT